MGWTSFYIGDSERTEDAIKRELNQINDDGASWDLIDHSMRGAVLYGIMCRHQADSTKRAAGSPEKMFYGVVVLTERRTRDGDTEIFYKEMTEDCGPYYYDMPARMLNFLDKNAPEPYGHAKHWREQCRYRIQVKKERAKAKRLVVA